VEKLDKGVIIENESQFHSSPCMTNTTLNNLPVGARARVDNIELDSAASQRLMTLGLLPGIDVRVVQHAPLGDPIAIEFEGRRVSLRKSEAAGVFLTIIN